MGVSSQILIKKSREGVHIAGGEPVTGVVKYLIDEKAEYQDVALSFIGKAKCSWSDGSDTYTGTENFLTMHVNITNKNPGKTIILKPGSYEYPFEFYLPENIPSSFKDWAGSVAYKIQLKFTKANLLSFNKKFTAEITVYGSVKSNSTSATSDGPVIFGLEKPLKALFTTKSPAVYLKAEIAKTCLIPGENVHLFYKVTNDTDVTITSVKTELYCITTYTADSGRTYINQKKVRGCKRETKSIRARAACKFSFTLPTRRELYSIQHSRVISREYRVRATVRLPLPHFNATVEMPVVLGQRAGDARLEMITLEGLQLEDEALNTSNLPKPSTHASGSRPASGRSRPPSYWRVMNEEKTAS